MIPNFPLSYPLNTSSGIWMNLFFGIAIRIIPRGSFPPLRSVSIQPCGLNCLRNLNSLVSWYSCLSIVCLCATACNAFSNPGPEKYEHLRMHAINSLSSRFPANNASNLRNAFAVFLYPRSAGICPLLILCLCIWDFIYSCIIVLIIPHPPLRRSTVCHRPRLAVMDETITLLDVMFNCIYWCLFTASCHLLIRDRISWFSCGFVCRQWRDFGM